MEPTDNRFKYISEIKKGLKSAEAETIQGSHSIQYVQGYAKQGPDLTW